MKSNCGGSFYREHDLTLPNTELPVRIGYYLTVGTKDYRELPEIELDSVRNIDTGEPIDYDDQQADLLEKTLLALYIPDDQSATKRKR
jgi:hypothetical protein